MTSLMLIDKGKVFWHHQLPWQRQYAAFICMAGWEVVRQGVALLFSSPARSWSCSGCQCQTTTVPL